MSLTVEQARALVPNRKALYQALRRNQYIMPDIKENLVTSAWMLGVV